MIADAIVRLKSPFQEEVEGQIADADGLIEELDCVDVSREKVEHSAWETLCDAGREAAENMDEGRWIIGDLAMLVRKEYGHDKIGDFAEQIGVKKKRVQEYRTVCKYYLKDDRDLFRVSHPPMTYTHFRAAMRLKDLQASYDILERATVEKEPWTAERMELEVAQKLGKTTPPEPVISGKFCNIKDGGEERYVMFEFPDKATWLTLMQALKDGRGDGLLMTLRVEG